jgi:hypothetical protein
MMGAATGLAPRSPDGGPGSSVVNNELMLRDGVFLQAGGE